MRIPEGNTRCICSHHVLWFHTRMLSFCANLCYPHVICLRIHRRWVSCPYRPRAAGGVVPPSMSSVPHRVLNANRHFVARSVFFHRVYLTVRRTNLPLLFTVRHLFADWFFRPAPYAHLMSVCVLHCTRCVQCLCGNVGDESSVCVLCHPLPLQRARERLTVYMV
jgi:hypothetical protein